MVETHIALLRGINVGGKNKLPMNELRTIFMDAGTKDVRTYIQSGNVVFAASSKVLDNLANTITTGIENRLGLKLPVILRSQAELEKIRNENPYRNRTNNPKELHVVFLRDEPAPTAAAGLDPHHSSPDEFTVLRQDVFLFCPNGLARSKLTTTWFDRTLKTVSTIRNWNTVEALVNMCQEKFS